MKNSGNRVSMMDTIGSSSYETDAIGRITSATNRPESNTATYITYDEEGNITRLMNVCTACDQTLSSYEYTYNEMGKLAENRKTLENSSAKLSYIQSRFGTNEERMPSDVRAELCKLRSTMKNISEQNLMLCDSSTYYQKQDAAGNAQLQMAFGTISLVLAPYADLHLQVAVR